MTEQVKLRLTGDFAVLIAGALILVALAYMGAL
jgi:hypothetical protein